MSAAVGRACRACRWSLVAALVASSLAGAGLPSAGLALELADLDGTNGFVLNGIAAGDRTGLSTSAAGDVNGDGVDDLIVGAYHAAPNGGRSGASYVVFGGPGVGASGAVNLASLNGSNGFVLNGVASGDWSGVSVSAAGNVNADGFDDLIIGALYADPNGPDSGASYVVFGGPGVGSGGVLELSALDGSNGFVLNGVARDDRSGLQVSTAGDVNVDGVDDLLISGYRSDANGFEAGAVYVVFGGAGVGSGGVVELSALDGSNGFVLNGVAAEDFAGNSLSAAGDVNGDGVDDLLIGAIGADPNGLQSGASYVVFGGPGVGSSGIIELSALDGTNGFVVNGVAPGDLSARSVSAAGDVNGDGVDDVLIGAIGADSNGFDSGASYVVFGGAGVGSGGVVQLSTLDGTNGFALNGAAEDDSTGRWVSAAGDVNRDQVDDLIVGAWNASPNGFHSGASYVVFGGIGVGSSGIVELSTLDGTSGLVLNGGAEVELSGRSVGAAGDVNADGIDDLLVGAPAALSNGSRSGAVYVVFGSE